MFMMCARFEDADSHLVGKQSFVQGVEAAVGVTSVEGPLYMSDTARHSITTRGAACSPRFTSECPWSMVISPWGLRNARKAGRASDYTVGMPLG